MPTELEKSIASMLAKIDEQIVIAEQQSREVCSRLSRLHTAREVIEELYEGKKK